MIKFENPIYEIGIKLNQSIDSRLKDGGIDADNLEVEEFGERANEPDGPPPPEGSPHLKDLIKEEMKKGSVYGHFC